MVDFDTTNDFATPAKMLQKVVVDRDTLFEATIYKLELLIELNKTEVVGAIQIGVLD